jgi:hypothetical protein
VAAKPTDGLLVCLSAVRTGYLDLDIVKRAFGDDRSLSENPAKVDTATLSLAASEGNVTADHHASAIHCSLVVTE